MHKNNCMRKVGFKFRILILLYLGLIIWGLTAAIVHSGELELKYLILTIAVFFLNFVFLIPVVIKGEPLKIFRYLQEIEVFQKKKKEH